MLKLVLLCLISPCLCLTSPLFGLSMKEKLATASEGSYVVTAQDKSATFLFIRSNTEHGLLMEEVTIPMSRAPREWKEWFQEGAPGHTLWTSSWIDLERGEVKEIFSFTHEGWIDQSEANHFFGTLLNLPFYEIPIAERKRVGFPPKHGQFDKRVLWEPPLIIEGEAQESAHFQAFHTRWPNDRSELARHKIEIYFPENGLSFFPHWIEVDGKVTVVRMHVIDSGEKARSPKPQPPLHPPSISGLSATSMHSGC